MPKRAVWKVVVDLDDDDAVHTPAEHERQVSRYYYEQQCARLDSSDAEEGSAGAPVDLFGEDKGAGDESCETPSMPDQLDDYRHKHAAQFVARASAACTPVRIRGARSNFESVREDSDEDMGAFNEMASAAKARRHLQSGAGAAVNAGSEPVQAHAAAPAVADEADDRAPAVADELRLNSQQRAAVALGRGDQNIMICGGGGVGKSETVTSSIGDSKKINAVMGPHHSSLNIITRKCKQTLSPTTFAGQRFMTVNKGTGVHVGDEWDAREIITNFESEGRAGLQDTVTADRCIIDEVGQLDPDSLSTMREAVESLRGKGMPWTFVGDLQTRPIKNKSGEAIWFFESEAFSEDFVIVGLQQSYRVKDPRATQALKDIKIRRDSPEVRSFFAKGEDVDLAGHERETAHLFCSNEEAEKFARKDLIKIYGLSATRSVKATPDHCNYGYAQRNAFGLKFVWDLTLVLGEDYSFTGSDGGMVEVDGVPLRNRDKLRCTMLDDGDGKAEFCLMDREGDVRVMLSRVERQADYQGVTYTASAFCLKYSRYGPVFSRQGDEWDYVWVHAEKIKGPNVLYTGLTRCKGSPFDGKLKISGLRKAFKRPEIVNGQADWSHSHVKDEDALNIKWAACPKMVVFQQIVFGDVPSVVYDMALAAIPSTPHWQRVLAKLQKMRVVRGQ